MEYALNALAIVLVLVACSGTASALTVIPPGPVVEGGEVEVRLAVSNPSAEAGEFRVRFYWDVAEHANLVEARGVTVAGGQTEVVAAWAPTEGRVGERTILAQTRAPDGTVTESRFALEVRDGETAAVPVLAGGWLDPGILHAGFGYPRDREVTVADVRDVVDAMHDVGMDTAIVTYVEFFGPYYPSEIEEFAEPLIDFDVVGTILEQADRNGMHVFLGLSRGDDTLLLWDGLDDPERMATGIDLGTRVAAELWELYGHHPSLYGWYLTHEANDIAKAGAYYDAVADFCKTLAPEKPVLVAPAGTPIISPEILRNSHVDIFAYQDAVGAGYKDYKYTLDPEQRIAELDEVYGHYRDTHAGTGKHLWTDLEIWRANPETGYAPFNPAPIGEVKRQIGIEAKYVEFITAYEFFCSMAPPESTLRLGGDEAVRLYEGYREWVDGRAR